MASVVDVEQNKVTPPWPPHLLGCVCVVDPSDEVGLREVERRATPRRQQNFAVLHGLGSPLGGLPHGFDLLNIVRQQRQVRVAGGNHRRRGCLAVVALCVCAGGEAWGGGRVPDTRAFHPFPSRTGSASVVRARVAILDICALRLSLMRAFCRSTLSRRRSSARAVSSASISRFAAARCLTRTAARCRADWDRGRAKTVSMSTGQAAYRVVVAGGYPHRAVRPATASLHLLRTASRWSGCAPVRSCHGDSHQGANSPTIPNGHAEVLRMSKNR